MPTPSRAALYRRIRTGARHHGMPRAMLERPQPWALQLGLPPQARAEAGDEELDLRLQRLALDTGQAVIALDRQAGMQALYADFFDAGLVPDLGRLLWLPDRELGQGSEVLRILLLEALLARRSVFVAVGALHLPVPVGPSNACGRRNSEVEIVE